MTDLPVYTVPQLCERWQMGKNLAYEMIQKGLLKTFKLPGSKAIRIPASEVNRIESGD